MVIIEKKENPYGSPTKKNLTKKHIMQQSRNRSQQTEESIEEPPTRKAKSNQDSEEISRTTQDQ